MYDILYLEDSLVCQANLLSKKRACIRDLEDQARDVGEALRQQRSAWKRAEKMEEELRAVLMPAQHEIRKKRQFCVERLNLSKKKDAQNKRL